jgi:hypothetical protein
MIIPLPLMTVHVDFKRKKDTAPEPQSEAPVQSPQAAAVPRRHSIVENSDLIALALVALILVSVVALVLASRSTGVA